MNHHDMSKWCDYVISHIWTARNLAWKGVDDNLEITNVLLHQDLGDAIDVGVKWEVIEVTNLLDAGYTIKTVTWNYETGQWRVGSDVESDYGPHYIGLYSHDAYVRNDCLKKLPRLNY